MSFDEHMGKGKRKPYRGGKAIDKTCRNHGSCPACLANRTFANTKRKQAADDELKDLLYARASRDLPRRTRH